MIKWHEPKKPDETCSYDYLIGETPFGNILITWKSWKDYPNFEVDEPEWLAHNCHTITLDETKEWCEQEYEARIRTACAALEKKDD